MPFKNPHPLYPIWQAMRRRCLTPTTRQWSDYGGRGIKICPEWDSFAQFLADMGPRPPRHTLERIDNDGDYTPDNCRWATRREQSRNQRVTRVVTIEGREYLACELAERFGLKTDTIVNRARDGLTFEQVASKRRRPSEGWKKAVAARVASQLARTHCKNGHPWTPENTRYAARGRECRACNRIKSARQNAEKRRARREG